MIWNRPGNSTVASPVRTDWAETGRRCHMASKAASTPEAFSNWLAPRKDGYAIPLKRFWRPPHDHCWRSPA